MARWLCHRLLRNGLHLALLASLIGCVSPPTPPAADSIVLSADLKHGAARWQSEARKRFERPVIFHCHGFERDGVWMCLPDEGPALPVEGVARLLKKLYPGREIVLVVCNEAGLKLNVRGVWYAEKGVVWSLPHWPANKGVNCVLELVQGE